MGLFDSILTKLGLKKAAPTAAPAQPKFDPLASFTPTTQKMEMVDVVSKIEGMAKKNPMKLNWKESIVDLLVVLDLPHGANDLKELAVELKCPANIVDDSFKRNMWLHKAVLKAIADNGGNIPKSLLD